MTNIIHKGVKIEEKRVRGANKNKPKAWEGRSKIVFGREPEVGEEDK